MPRLLDAYRRGIFPWFNEEDPVLWWSPDPRMVLLTDRVHVSRSLRKRVRSGALRVTCDVAFGEVMRGCAAPRRGQDGTWITRGMVYAYEQLAAHGYAHSVEVWEGESLVGGLYGVGMGRMFFGESMFTRRADASKVALVALVERLRERGFTLLDTQWTTEHLEQFGAREIARADYLRRLNAALRLERRFA
jgi:leucyl/phenylalanyl-tRNA--protein transferase